MRDREEEQESPAKQYQIVALQVGIDTLKEGLTEVKGILQEASEKSVGKEYVDNQIKLVHLEYRPIKNSLKFVAVTIGSVLLIAVVQFFLNNYGK